MGLHGVHARWGLRLDHGGGRVDARRRCRCARIVAAQRHALLEMRSKDEIGDDAFHQIEAQLDVAEVNALGAEYP